MKKIFGLAIALIIVLLAEKAYTQGAETKNKMTMPELLTNVNIRYIVNDVGSSLSFYTDFLNFKVAMHPAKGFALLTRGNLRLFLNEPGAGGAGQAMPDGTVPSPGGWNRIQIEVENLEDTIKKMKSKHAKFRNDLVVGIGGKQILLEDPSGNLIELFEPKR